MKSYKNNKSITLSEFNKFISKKSSSRGKVDQGLGMLCLMTYIGLKFQTNRSGIVQSSYSELSEILGISKSAAQKSIYKLEQAKLIKRLPSEWKTAIPTYKVIG